MRERYLGSEATHRDSNRQQSTNTFRYRWIFVVAIVTMLEYFRRNTLVRFANNEYVSVIRLASQDC